jgi:hypothetical protein
MEKTPARPRWGLVRTYTARALGSGGLESARHVLTLRPIAFGNLYQIAHPEPTVEKWRNSTLWATKRPETEGILCQPK